MPVSSDRKQLDGASLETQVANCTKHALRVLGITIYVYKENDEKHERYKIQVGLTQLYSDMELRSATWSRS